MNFDISANEPGVDPDVEKRVAARGRRFSVKERRAVQDRFLQAYEQDAIFTAACGAAGIHRSLPRYWAEHDGEFSMRLQAAEVVANDRIRTELHRRAIEGVRRERTTITFDSAGNPTGSRTESITERSDQLLMFLAKARLDEFRNLGGTWVVDGETLRVVFDVISRSVSDQDTLDRIRTEFAKLAEAGA